VAASLGIARLLPIADPLSVPSTARGIGLYLNPNTLGNVEAMVLVLALWWGIPRRQIPLVILVLAGLVLSGSREALLGTVVATLAVGAIYPGRVTPLALGGAVAFVVSFLLLPEIAARFDPGTFASDRSLSDRLLSWDQALHAIGLSPALGYGLERNAVVDQAFLEWLVSGGIVGFGIWLVGIGLLTIGSRAWPVVLAMAVGGLLANTFAGPPLMLMLFVAGITAGAPGSGGENMGPIRRVALCGLLRPSLAPPARQRWRTPDRPQR
jgi:O-antigen ligase